ncbi:MAG TPA: BON domain-containing protein [Symbiobacteriaceae bacterium]
MAEHQSRNQDHQKAFNPPGVQEPFNHDLHLMKEVKDALLKGTESAGIDVQVSAEDGTVRLHGVVDVLSHRTVAEEIARKVTGVKQVVNDLTVADEEHKGDKQLTEVISNHLAKHTEYRDMGCKVHKGEVLLVGHAGSYDDVHAAVRMVEGLPGVVSVRVQKVKVGEGQKEDDADVSRAAERLLGELGFKKDQFQVYCDAGVLFVKGFVPTKADRSRVKAAMHTIQGVDKLEALLVTDDEVGGEIH